jgi:ubiquitin C-terminal hydrolase
MPRHLLKLALRRYFATVQRCLGPNVHVLRFPAQPGIAAVAEGEYELRNRHCRFWAADAGGGWGLLPLNVLPKQCESGPPPTAPDVAAVLALAGEGVDPQLLSRPPAQPAKAEGGREEGAGPRPGLRLLVVRASATEEARDGPRGGGWRVAAASVQAAAAKASNGASDDAILIHERSGLRFVRWTAPLPPGCEEEGYSEPPGRQPLLRFGQPKAGQVPLVPQIRAPRRRAEAPLTGAESWRALRASTAAAHGGGTGESLLHAPLRVYLPVDDDWASGRIVAFDKGSGRHRVRYDDGETKWLNLGEREYALSRDVGGEVVGRSVALRRARTAAEPAEVPSDAAAAALSTAASREVVTPRPSVATGYAVAYVDLSSSTPMQGVGGDMEGAASSALVPVVEPAAEAHPPLSRPPAGGEIWSVGSIVAYDPDTELHLLRYADESGMEAVSLNAHPHQWLTELHLLPAGMRLLGRRVAVVLDGALLQATITQYRPPQDEVEVVVRAAGGEVAPAVAAALLACGDAFARALPELEMGAAGAKAPGLAAALALAAASHPHPAGIATIRCEEGRVVDAPLGSLHFSLLEDGTAGTPPAPGAIGLANLGNSCYLNSVAQALLQLRPFARTLAHPSLLTSLSTGNSAAACGGRMALAIALLVREVWGSEGRQSATAATALPRALLAQLHPDFAGSGHQDAHEALMALLDALHEDTAIVDAAATAQAAADAAAEEEEEAKEAEAERSGAGSARAAFFSFSRRNVSVESEDGSAAAPLAPSASRSVPPEMTSLVKRLFFLHTQTERVCSRNSKHVSLRRGPRGGEWLPPISLTGKVTSRAPGVMGLLGLSKATQRDPGLVDCLDAYFRTAEGELELKCGRCPRASPPVPHSTRWHLLSLPPVLIIQIQRFEVSPTTGTRTKIAAAVAFPLEGLDMGRYLHPSAEGQLSAGRAAIDGPASPKAGRTGDNAWAPGAPYNGLYDLAAVVCHDGSLEHGHYTTYGRAADPGVGGAACAWMHFDDAVVTAVPEHEVTCDRTAGQAYLLLYVRQTRESAVAAKEARAARAKAAAAAPPTPTSGAGAMPAAAAGATGWGAPLRTPGCEPAEQGEGVKQEGGYSRALLDFSGGLMPSTAMAMSIGGVV